MANDNHDLARLVYEAIAQSGHTADPEAVVHLVQRLDRGLPAEDEFMVLCTWLGQCKLIHKLDQVQMPPKSTEVFQVPDLLVAFAADGKSVTALIEVKTSLDNVLSFRPDYYDRLRHYAELLRLPLLIAWKWHSVWCLFDAAHMTQMNKNFNINWKTAIGQSLLGLLAGDFSYVLENGVGIHVRCRKIRPISSTLSADCQIEEWATEIDDVYFTTGDRQRALLPDADIPAVLVIADLEHDSEVSDTHIIQHFTAPTNMGLFAHAALVRLLDFQNEDTSDIHWRSHIKDASALKTIAGFKHAVTQAMSAGFVRYILNPRPKTTPSFLS